MLCLDMERFYKKAGRLLAGILLLQAVLVFLHLGHVGDVWPPGNPRHELGEFWPFSIYPMFSQGGRPWVRSLVREVTDASDPQLWRPRIVDELPGAPYVMDTRGIDLTGSDVGAIRQLNSSSDADAIDRCGSTTALKQSFQHDRFSPRNGHRRAFANG